MARDFFLHIKKKQAVRSGAILAPEDLVSFTTASEKCIKGFLSSDMSNSLLNVNTQTRVNNQEAVTMTDREFYEQDAGKFYRAMLGKTGKIVKKALLIRGAITLVAHRLNLIKAVRGSKPVF